MFQLLAIACQKITYDDQFGLSCLACSWIFHYFWLAQEIRSSIVWSSKWSKELREFDENCIRYVYFVGLIFCSSLLFQFQFICPWRSSSVWHPWNFHADKKTKKKANKQKQKLRIIPKWLTPKPVTERLIDFYFISRIHGCSLRFEFTHFYNITSTFHEVSSVSPKSSVTHSN